MIDNFKNHFKKNIQFFFNINIAFLYVLALTVCLYFFEPSFQDRYSFLLQIINQNAYKFIFLLIILVLFCRYKYFFQIVILIFLVFYTLLFSFYPILFLIIFFFSSILLGFFIINTFFYRSSLFNFENLSIGICSYGLIVNMISFFPINYLVVYLVLIVFPFFLTLKNFIFYKTEVLKFYKLIFSKISLNILTSLIIFNILLLIYVVTVTPDLSHDSRAAHLVVPFKIKEYGFWKYNINDYIWSVMPMGAHWLFSLSNMFAGEPGIRLLNSTLFVVNAFVVFTFVRKETNFNYGLFAALIFSSIPMSFHLISTTQPETLLCLLLTIGFIELFKEKINFPIVFILFGYALNTKFTVILLIPFLYLVVFFYFFKDKINLKTILISSFLLILFSFLPYLNAFIKTGSPTFPLFNEIFQSDLISKEAFYHPAFAKKSFLDLILVSFKSAQYGAIKGALGIFFVFIIPYFLLQLLYLSKKIIFYLFICFFFISIIWFFQAYLRYIFPIFTWLICIFFIVTYKANNKFYIIYYPIVIINLLLIPNSFTPAPNYLYYFNKNLNNKLSNDNIDLQIAKIINSNPKYDKKIFLKLSGLSNYADYKGTLISLSWHSRLFWLDSIYENKNIKKILSKNNIDYVIIADNLKISKPFDFYNNIKDYTDKVFVYKNYEIRKFKKLD